MNFITLIVRLVTVRYQYLHDMFQFYKKTCKNTFNKFKYVEVCLDSDYRKSTHIFVAIVLIRHKNDKDNYILEIKIR